MVCDPGVAVDLDQKIGVLKVKIESGLKGMQTSISGLKWYVIITGSVMTAAIAFRVRSPSTPSSSK